MQVKYNMVVDFARPSKSNTILIAEDDANSRKVYFTLLFDKAPFDMTGVTTATIRGITSSGATIYDDATIEVDEEGNIINMISWVIPAPIADTAGNITLTVTLADNVGARITSFEFYIKVRNALYNEDDYIDDDDLEGFRDLLARTRAALEKMEQMVQQEALPNPYPIRITVDNVTYEYNGEEMVEILMGEVAYLGDVSGTVDITADDSAAEQARRAAEEAAESAEEATEAYQNTQILINNFESQIPTATVTKNTATHETTIYITDKNGTTSATVEDGVIGSSWYSGIVLTGQTTASGVEGVEGDWYLNTHSGNIYKCTTTGDNVTAIWTYQLTMNINSFTKFRIAGTDIVADGDDTMELIAGTSNVTLTPDAINKTITISVTGGGGGGGGGDMYKSVYDTDNDGVVNSADTLSGLSASVSELNSLQGIVGNVETRLAGKANTSHTHVMADITNLSIPDELADLQDDTTHRVVTDTQITTWNGKQDALTAGTGISIQNDVISATGASQLGYKTVKVGNKDVEATLAEDTIEFEASTGMTITADPVNKKLTFASTGGSSGGGDMLKMVYDHNNDGVVNSADTLSGLTASIAELNYVDGVTSNVQTQLDGKAASSHTHVVNDITNFPTIPTALSQLNEDTLHRVVTDSQVSAWSAKQNALTAGNGITLVGDTISATGAQSDWAESDPTADDFIKNKPSIPTTLDTLTNVTISLPDNGDILKYIGGSWVNGKESQGGHTMLPDPTSSAPATDSAQESAIVTQVNLAHTATGEGWANDDVPSLNTVAVWTNVKVLTVLVKNNSHYSGLTATGLGTWQDPSTLVSPTKAQEEAWGWVEIPELVGIGTDNDTTVRITYDSAKCGGALTLGGYIIDDSTGMMCVKFGNEIPSASVSTAVVGIEIYYRRNYTREVGQV